MDRAVIILAPLVSRYEDDGDDILLHHANHMLGGCGITFGEHSIFEAPEGFPVPAGGLVLGRDVRQAMGDYARDGIRDLLACPLRGTSRRTGQRHEVRQSITELLYEHRNDEWGTLQTGVLTFAGAVELRKHPSLMSAETAEQLADPLAALKYDVEEVWLNNRLVWFQLVPKMKHSQTFNELLPNAGGALNSSQTLAWAHDSGGSAIDVIAAAGTPNTAYGRQNTQSSTIDGYRCTSTPDTANVQVSYPFEFTTVNTTTRDSYAYVRATNVSSAGYRSRCRSNTGGYSHSINRLGGTGGSGVLSSPSGDPGATGTHTLKFNGSTLTGTYGSAGATSVTETDATLNGNKQCGIGLGNNAGASVDQNRIHATITIQDVATGLPAAVLSVLGGEA
jgi:hypothetical protein